MTIYELLDELNGHVFRATSGNVAVLMVKASALEDRQIRVAVNNAWAHPTVQSDLEEVAQYIRSRCEVLARTELAGRLQCSPGQFENIAQSFVKGWFAGDPSVN